jgi:alkylhydroperoxidase family enzyme
VITPMQVIYARKPQLLFIANKILKFEKASSLDASLRLLILTQVSMLNGCGFCNDIALALVVQQQLGKEKFFVLGEDVAAKREMFTARERVVIAFVEEYAKARRVSDETFAELRKHFNETEIIEIVAMNAFEHYFNAFAIPLGIESDGLRHIAEQQSTIS